jgi:hypothetical protein
LKESIEREKNIIAWYKEKEERAQFQLRPLDLLEDELLG